MPTTPQHDSPWLAWCQLCRIPNVFTAIADVWMGYWFVNPSLARPETLAMLTLSSACLYTAGMVFNDVYDVAQDRAERPHRPIPSGRISLHQAQHLGIWLLVAGVWIGWLAGGFPYSEQAAGGRAGVVATMLAGTVLAYDLRLKRTAWGGALGMGACRTLNVLLGMSVPATLTEGTVGMATWHPAQLLVAAGIGTYIAGVTWFARTEARTSARWSLVGALLVMLIGYGFLASYPWVSDASEVAWRVPPAGTWALMLAAVSIPLVRRAAVAIARPEPTHVQAVVKFAILSLIVLDAAVCFAARGPLPALTIVALLVPAMALGRYVYST